MPLYSKGFLKKCGSCDSATSTQYTFDTLITLSIQEYTSENGVTVETKDSITRMANVKSVSTRSFGSSTPFNTVDVQNQFGTSYIFTILYVPDFYLYQYIHHQGFVYKIQNSENKNLKNEFCVFITTHRGQSINQNNYL